MLEVLFYLVGVGALVALAGAIYAHRALPMMSSMRKEPAAPPEPTPEDIELLREIRDALRK